MFKTAYDKLRRSLKSIRICRSKYRNNRFEQDHRRIKRRVHSVLDGIKMVYMMRKRQARFAYNPRPSVAEQFEILAA